MPSVQYYLKPSSDGDGLVMATFFFNQDRLRLSTGEKVKPKYWIQGKKGKKSRAINAWEFKGEELNFRLKKIEDFLLSEYRRQLNDGVNPTRASIHDAFMGFLNKKKVERVSLLDYIDIFLARYKKTLNWRTLGRYQLLKVRLADFEKKSGLKADFDAINKKFYEAFCEYCQEGAIRQSRVKGKPGTKKEKLKDVSIGNMIKSLKRVLNEAVDEDKITDNLEHRKEYFKVFDEDADSVFLSEQEIEQWYSMKIDDPYLRYKRDKFILACYTGLRFSDWPKLTPQFIIGDGRLLQAMTYKTSELVVIPLSKTAREILERYKGSDFVLPSNVKMNKTLKKLGQLAEMHQTMNVSSTSGGIVTTVSRKKWELITTHTARRSFATNAFLSGIPTISIMKITGHKTERSFLKYIRISKLENALKLAEHPFFNR